MGEFLQFNIGQVAQIVVYVAGIVWLFSQVKGDVKFQNVRLQRIENEVLSLKDLIVSTTRLEEQIKSLREVVTLQGRRLDRLSYGWQEEDNECPNRRT